MSSAKRTMEQRRARRRCGGPREPYATMHADLVLACASTLSGPEFGLLMLLNANFTMPPGTSGETLVPFAAAQAALRAGPGTVAAAFRRLADMGFIRLKRPGVRPGAAGGAQTKGKAAVYELPHRTSSAPRFDWPIEFQVGGI